MLVWSVQPLFLSSSLAGLKSFDCLDSGLDTDSVGQGESIGEVRINQTRNIRNEEGRSNLTKDKGRGGRWSVFLNRPCGLLLLVLLVFSSTCSPKGSSSTSTTSSPTSLLRVLVALPLFLLLGLLLLLLERRRRARTLDGADLSSSLGLLRVSGARGEFLFPAMIDHLFYLVAVEQGNIICLADELDESSHGGWHLGDEYHGFEMLGDDTFCGGHPHKVGDDFLQGKRRIGVVRNGGGHF